jgi:uncharacterized protein YoxC
MVDDPDDLRRKADRFERLMSTVTDLRALQALRDLARSYRQRAEQIIGRRRQQGGSSSIDDTPQSQ